MKLLIVLLILAGLAGLPSPASGAVLFREDFNGAAGAQPNQSIWRFVNKCQYVISGRACDEWRARQTGNGSLYLETTTYRGAFVGTFDWGTGWPPSGVRASWSVPFTVTARLKMPTATGVWTVLWLMNVDRAWSQGVWELDLAEPRSALPTKGAAYHHYFYGGNHWNYGASTEIGGAGGWHTYKIQVLSDRTIYTVDGKWLMQRGAVKGRFGLLLTSLSGPSGSWFTNYGPALSGTARSYIDYIEVTR